MDFIREYMVDALNKKLEGEQTLLRANYSKSDITGRSQVEIHSEDKYFNTHHILSLTDDFQDMVCDHFKGYGVKLGNNNTGTVFWGINKDATKETKDLLLKLKKAFDDWNEFEIEKLEVLTIDGRLEQFSTHDVQDDELLLQYMETAIDKAIAHLESFITNVTLD